MTTCTQIDVERVSHEKSGIMHSEHQRGGLSEGDFDFLTTFPEHRKKAIIRKVDVGYHPLLWRKSLVNSLQLRLVPMLVLLYLIAYLDKTNIGEYLESYPVAMWLTRGRKRQDRGND